MAHLLPSHLHDAEYARQSFMARPAAGTPPVALLDPAWWAHVAARFTPGDRIEVLALDGSYDLELRVIGIGHNWLRVRVLRSWPEAALDVGAMSPDAVRPAEAFIEWGGPAHKWRTVRSRDKSVIAHGFETREAAEQSIRKAA